MHDTWTWSAPDFPPIRMRPVEPCADGPLLHQWLSHPRSHWWQMTHLGVADVIGTYRDLAADPHQDAWLGLVDGVPLFLVETYDPLGPLGRWYAHVTGDLGMHLLVAPPEGPPVPGLTDRVMAATLRLCFDHLGASRVVVEPDVRNLAVHGKNAAAGFVAEGPVELPEKTALLSTLSATAFRASRLGQLGIPRRLRIDHLDPVLTARAHRLIVAKTLGEFAHEFLIEPEALTEDRYRLTTPSAQWTWTARRHQLNHWDVDPDSIERTGHTPVEAGRLITELAGPLGIAPGVLPHYLEELNATVAARALTLGPDRPTAWELVNADLPTVESAMAEGHPCFVATNGRTGFTQRDHRAYAPERGRVAAPFWVGVRREVGQFRHTAAESFEEARLRALGPELIGLLEAELTDRGLDPADHHLLPVHPWQWERHLGTTFAPDVARGDLVPLCSDPVPHRPQQSIRTWLPLDGRPYVKMALGIQNMGFVRGLSPAYLRVTPAINDYVAGVVRNDPELRGFDVLTEFASIGYVGDDFHRLGDANSHTKLLAALWRENPLPRLGRGERAITMAALLHRDARGRALCPELVRASGLPARTWLRSLLTVTLRPVLHLLAHHRLAFMPHGENVILRLADQAPVGAWLKDIGEEAALLDAELPLPAEIERIRCVVDDVEAARVIFTDVFDGFLRFLGALWDREGLLPATAFWDEVADVIGDYVAAHPEAERLDLFADSFEHTCLNRLQLRDPSRMVDLADQPGSLIRVGRLVNPIARVPVR